MAAECEPQKRGRRRNSNQPADAIQNKFNKFSYADISHFSFDFCCVKSPHNISHKNTHTRMQQKNAQFHVLSRKLHFDENYGATWNNIAETRITRSHVKK
jgi:hypothetical protein